MQSVVGLNGDKGSDVYSKVSKAQILIQTFNGYRYIGSRTI